ncbi:hypothetical protein GCM10012275_15350 [Longimycelium tulufanense]|uniref:HTH cro/C1-type domain-containing protein n=1 Tax=Longimycelium tulufanense TaxID=907463 RepID=A0A8J3C6Y4_9PSEU|nr:helix-turn-helix transcriptional regulator [Longimycelium tulufanense]GGM45234.1 hypothetical protein GCM10012275_15350 [Longimycelium tulufanense]
MITVRRPTFSDFLRHLRTSGEAQEVLGQPPKPRPRLSRTQLASTAAISIGYLIKLEQGHAQNPAAEVVERLADALQATPLERAHLRDLAIYPQLPEPTPSPTRLTPADVDTELVDSHLPHLAGYVDECWNVIYANAEYSRIYRRIDAPDIGNVLLWFFQEPQARRIMVEWETEARLTVSWFRAHMARRRNPLFDETLHTLSRCPEFVTMWNRQEVSMGRHQRHMLVRDLDRGEVLTLRAEVYPTPDPTQALQLYVGLRVNG